MFESEKIKFVKNVNYPGKNTLAYGEYLLGADFNLEFPDTGKPNAENLGLSAGDVVLLYQTVEGKLLFTHLVRIESTEVSDNPENKDYPFSLRAHVVGKIPDGVERDVTSLADALSFRGIAVSGNLVGLESAINPKMRELVEVETVRERICAIFRREGSLEQ